MTPSSPCMAITPTDGADALNRGRSPNSSLHAEMLCVDANADPGPDVAAARHRRCMLGLRVKKETVNEIAACRARSMRAFATPVHRRSTPTHVVDVCGTGGDGAAHAEYLDRRSRLRGRRPVALKRGQARQSRHVRRSSGTCRCTRAALGRQSSRLTLEQQSPGLHGRGRDMFPVRAKPITAPCGTSRRFASKLGVFPRFSTCWARSRNPAGAKRPGQLMGVFLRRRFVGSQIARAAGAIGRHTCAWSCTWLGRHRRGVARRPVTTEVAELARWTISPYSEIHRRRPIGLADEVEPLA